MKIGSKNKKENSSLYYVPSAIIPEDSMNNGGRQRYAYPNNNGINRENYNKYGPQQNAMFYSAVDQEEAVLQQENQHQLNYQQQQSGSMISNGGSLTANYQQTAGRSSEIMGRNYSEIRKINAGKMSLSKATNSNFKGSLSKGNTVRYSDWFGSVANRRPPLRPSIPPSFVTRTPSPSQQQNGGGHGHNNYWNNSSMTELQPNQFNLPNPTIAQPQYYAIAVPPGMCACPTSKSGTTKGTTKKKKCKTCGQKTINIRHTLTAHPSFRPALSAAIYSAPIQPLTGLNQPTVGNNPSPFVGNMSPSPQGYPQSHTSGYSQSHSPGYPQSHTSGYQQSHPPG